jgi:phospholipase D1/2
MPLLPGFEGYIGDPAATVLRIQMHWQYQAISRSENSLFQRLLKEGFSRNDIDRYVYFFGLRKGEVLNKIPVTEIIYVHSKLMIVDDKKIIVGSANINDRSLLGNRDSEIAICIEDDDKKQTYSFRRKVFEEHFGLKPTDSIDINDDVVWDRLLNIAKKNTQIFRNVFGCIPDDYVSKIPDIEPFQ